MHDQTGHTSRDEGPRSPEALRVDDVAPGDFFLMKRARQPALFRKLAHPGSGCRGAGVG